MKDEAADCHVPARIAVAQGGETERSRKRQRADERKCELPHCWIATRCLPTWFQPRAGEFARVHQRAICSRRALSRWSPIPLRLNRGAEAESMLRLPHIRL